MLYLIWGLLNIGIFIYFVVICVKATKFIREQLGILASIIFVIGLLSFASRSNSNGVNKEPNSNQYKTWNFSQKDSLLKLNTVEVKMEKTMVSDYNLSIQYGVDEKRNSSIPISACSFNTGFVTGTTWNPILITVDTTADVKKLRYTVYGTVEWKLLNVTLYAQPKSYNGVVFAAQSYY